METNISKEEILNAFVKVIPYLPYLFEDEISIALTDTDKFLMNQTCQSLNVKSEIGGLILEGGAAAKAIHTGKLVVKEVAKEVYGVPFKSYAVPIKNTSCYSERIRGIIRENLIVYFYLILMKYPNDYGSITKIIKGSHTI